eukprot:366014-Chlamydomonas_euryale.AAC.12
MPMAAASGMRCSRQRRLGGDADGGGAWNAVPRAAVPAIRMLLGQPGNRCVAGPGCCTHATPSLLALLLLQHAAAHCVVTNAYVHTAWSPMPMSTLRGHQCLCSHCVVTSAYVHTAWSPVPMFALRGHQCLCSHCVVTSAYVHTRTACRRPDIQGCIPSPQGNVQHTQRAAHASRVGD